MTPAGLDDMIAEVHRRSTGEEALDRLATAVDVGDDLKLRADTVVNHFVGAARASGCSWAEIGGVLGVTRQAAQQRESGRRTRPGGRWMRSPGRSFERATDRMRGALVLADSEAERLRHDWLGTEHILLGLIAEGQGVAARALIDSGLMVERLRERTEQLVGAGPPAAASAGGEARSDGGGRPMSPRAKRAFDLGFKEARKLGHSYFGTEHMLLGLLAEGQGVAAQLLSEAGVDVADLRRRVLALVTGPATV